MGLWKYAMLGIVGKVVMVLSDSRAMWFAAIILIIVAWLAYCDIRRYLAGRKLKREGKADGQTS